MIIPAAGHASRYRTAGGIRHKLDEDLGDRPVLHRAIELFLHRKEVAALVVAGPYDQAGFDEFTERHGAKLGFYGATICRGGADHRWETVRNAITHIADDITHIAVHDAARPCTPGGVIDRVIEAGRTYRAVIPGVPIADTVRRTEPGDAVQPTDPLDAILGGEGRTNRSILLAGETIDRDGLFAIQTPQLFDATLLRRVYQERTLDATDDGGLVQQLGEPLHIVEGDPRNIKITTPSDLELARAILRVRLSADRPNHKRF